MYAAPSTASIYALIHCATSRLPSASRRDADSDPDAVCSQSPLGQIMSFAFPERERPPTGTGALVQVLLHAPDVRAEIEDLAVQPILRTYWSSAHGIVRR